MTAWHQSTESKQNCSPVHPCHQSLCEAPHSLPENVVFIQDAKNDM